MRNKAMFCFIPRKLCLLNEKSFEFLGWVWWQKAYLVNNLNYGWIAFADDQNEENLNPKPCEKCGK